MEIHAREAMAKEIEVLDLESGVFIRYCLWANQETGEYEQYVLDECNDFIIDYENDKALTKIYKGNIVLVYKGE